MRRFLALGVALLALLAAGFVWTRDRPVAVATEAAMPAADPDADPDAVAGNMGETALIAPKSDVTPAEREARRFARYDRDKDGSVGRDEYLASRKKAFARLDADGDGRLGFEEYSVATVKKFGKADRDGDGGLAAKEFATTAVKRKEKPACACDPAG